jgi:hypothetical protein
MTYAMTQANLSEERLVSKQKEQSIEPRSKVRSRDYQIPLAFEDPETLAQQMISIKDMFQDLTTKESVEGSRLERKVLSVNICKIHVQSVLSR